VDLGKSITEREFTGLSDCLKKTWRSDGIAGLYRGLVVSIPSIFIYRGLYFGIYDTGRDVILGADASLIVKFFWAQASVIFSEFLSYPGDTVKRKIMMQSLKKVK
jgi:solute carrier family 25 (adenine nucleotide translocator) protein 4/5/6/31